MQVERATPSAALFLDPLAHFLRCFRHSGSNFFGVVEVVDLELLPPHSVVGVAVDDELSLELSRPALDFFDFENDRGVGVDRLRNEGDFGSRGQFAA